MKTVLVNGEGRTTQAETVAALAEELDPAPQTLLIEHNGEALLRNEWDARPLADGDRIEVLKVAAGG